MTGAELLNSARIQKGLGLQVPMVTPEDLKKALVVLVELASFKKENKRIEKKYNLV